jgi:MFS family permease
VFGIVSTGFNIGGTIGPVAFAWIIDSGHPIWVFHASVALMLLTGILGLVTDRRPGRRHASQAAT